jgi:hypothetical protein
MKKILYSILLLLLASCSEESGNPTSKTQINVKNNPVNTTSYCAIDFPKLMPVNQGFILRGWAFDKISASLPEHVEVQFISENGNVFKSFDTEHGAKRPNLSKIFNQPGAEMSGFLVAIPANSLIPGKYKITILQKMPEHSVTCTKNDTYEVIEAVTPTTTPLAKVVATVDSAAKPQTVSPNTMLATKKRGTKLQSQQIVVPKE